MQSGDTKFLPCGSYEWLAIWRSWRRSQPSLEADWNVQRSRDSANPEATDGRTFSTERTSSVREETVGHNWSSKLPRIRRLNALTQSSSKIDARQPVRLGFGPWVFWTSVSSIQSRFPGGLSLRPERQIDTGWIQRWKNQMEEMDSNMETPRDAELWQGYCNLSRD